MTDRKDVIDCLKTVRDEITQLAEGAAKDSWSAETYENGWSARQLLSHIASTSGAAGFILGLAQASGASGISREGFDNESFNRQQVALREGKTVREVLDEIRANLQRDIQAVEAAPDELLQRHFRAPWDVEGSVAKVIYESVTGHLGGHVADLRAALSP